MSGTIKDSSIHRDGIYDIDESCYIGTKSISSNDGIVFALLAMLVLWK